MKKLLPILMSFALAGAVDAAPYSVVFSGVVDNDPYGTGWTTFNGVFTYDTDWLDQDPAAGIGSYLGSGPAYGISVAFDGGAASWNLYGESFMLALLDDYGGADEYMAHGSDGALLSMTLTLTDFSQSAFAGDALPLTVPELAGFDWVRFSLLDIEDEIGGQITHLSCLSGCAAAAGAPIQAIPAIGPFGLLLLGLGIAVAGVLSAPPPRHSRHSRNA